jgi:transcriptional regulator with XRE-family HTH domain
VASKFASRLAREMKQRKLTYAQFAEELGISASQLHDWIHQTHEPQLGTLRTMAKKLKCDLFDLIEAA